MTLTARDGTRLACAEAIHSGITFVHDWCHNIRGFDYAEADLRALRHRTAPETGPRYTDRPPHSLIS